MAISAEFFQNWQASLPESNQAGDRGRSLDIRLVPFRQIEAGGITDNSVIIQVRPDEFVDFGRRETRVVDELVNATANIAESRGDHNFHVRMSMDVVMGDVPLALPNDANLNLAFIGFIEQVVGGDPLAWLDPISHRLRRYSSDAQIEEVIDGLARDHFMRQNSRVHLETLVGEKGFAYVGLHFNGNLSPEFESFGSVMVSLLSEIGYEGEYRQRIMEEIVTGGIESLGMLHPYAKEFLKMYRRKQKDNL